MREKILAACAAVHQNVLPGKVKNFGVSLELCPQQISGNFEQINNGLVNLNTLKSERLGDSFEKNTLNSQRLRDYGTQWWRRGP